jgi:hypothetical protein
MFVEKRSPDRERLEREPLWALRENPFRELRPTLSQRATREVRWERRNGSGAGSGRMKDGRKPQ